MFSAEGLADIEEGIRYCRRSLALDPHSFHLAPLLGDLLCAFTRTNETEYLNRVIDVLRE